MPLDSTGDSTDCAGFDRTPACAVGTDTATGADARCVGWEVAHPCASDAVIATARDDISLFIKSPLYICAGGREARLAEEDCKVGASAERVARGMRLGKLLIYKIGHKVCRHRCAAKEGAAH